MNDLVQLLTTASVGLVGGVVVAYFLKFCLEKRVDSEFRMQEKRGGGPAGRLGRTSLEMDRAMSLQLQTAMTTALANFAAKRVAQYSQIAALLVELEDGVNDSPYRPIEDTAIDRA